jgi:hypothetical protein
MLLHDNSTFLCKTVLNISQHDPHLQKNGSYSLSKILTNSHHGAVLENLRSLREGDHWGDPDVDGRIILRWIFRK